MMSRVKNQHYVPQFLLRAFRNGKGGKCPQIWCLDKKTGECFSAAVRNVCAESSFYDRGDDQTVERGLAEMETTFGQCHAAVIRDKRLPVSRTRVGMAYLIAVQHLRTRAVRDTVKESALAAIETINARKAPAEPRFTPPPEKDFTKEGPARQQQFELMVKVVPRFVESLLEMKWTLLLNETDSPFWCSDSPFSITRSQPCDRNDCLGFLRPGSVTYFPLAPEISLMVADPECFGHLRNEIELSEPSTVTLCNRCQVENAERLVLSSTDDFSLAEEMIRAEPRLRDRPAYRFEGIDPDRLMEC